MRTIITSDGITIAEADKGKWLHKIDTDIYSGKIYLGKNDFFENWEEIDEIPEPISEEPTLDDTLNALHIMGVD